MIIRNTIKISNRVIGKSLVPAQRIGDPCQMIEQRLVLIGGCQSVWCSEQLGHANYVARSVVTIGRFAAVSIRDARKLVRSYLPLVGKRCLFGRTQPVSDRRDVATGIEDCSPHDASWIRIVRLSYFSGAIEDVSILMDWIVNRVTRRVVGHRLFNDSTVSVILVCHINGCARILDCQHSVRRVIRVLCRT